MIDLRDINPVMVEAWLVKFAEREDVLISCGNILDEEVQADAIVSPANSFGFMDGGIDLVYSRFFGWSLAERLQEHLRRHHSGELPVGQAVIVSTGSERIPWMICAPTMRVPENISSTVNAYLSFRAVLRAIDDFNAEEPRIEDVLCPGLGTAIGRMPHSRCAYQMYAALLLHEDPLIFHSLEEAQKLHAAMLSR